MMENSWGAEPEAPVKGDPSGEMWMTRSQASIHSGGAANAGERRGGGGGLPGTSLMTGKRRAEHGELGDTTIRERAIRKTE